jgi:hypothetical protein
LYTLPLSPNHYRTHKCPPTVPILSQLDPVRTLIFHFLTIRILSFHLFLGLPCVLFPSGSPKNILYTSLLSLKRATCPAYLILVCISRGVFGEECGSEPARDHCERQCLFSQCWTLWLFSLLVRSKALALTAWVGGLSSPEESCRQNVYFVSRTLFSVHFQ